MTYEEAKKMMEALDDDVNPFENFTEGVWDKPEKFIAELRELASALEFHNGDKTRENNR